jgi:cellulose synthase/poly-beta-1,6-N-acetylglucosamine synthase-like glycosyltransferase
MTTLDWPILNFILLLLHIVSVVGLAWYGFHTVWLSALYLTRTRTPSAPTDLADLLPPTAWPTVTVQLPIYNEQHVVERLIEACARLDYPQDKLQIQILDDSDDITTALANAAAYHWQQQGVHVAVVRRMDRVGYKAGALAYGMTQACGEFIAIFDADFVPPPDYLRRTMPYFFESGNARVGFVQTRWNHLNRGYSWLTRCQALALDGHFVVEQTARAGTGYAFGFNGSAGIWRRACIDDPTTGGWQTDTLCEDLDLSYRAQMQGWRGVYDMAIDVPAEIPVQLQAFKRQQFRWAKGSIQTLRKLAGQVAFQREWSWHKRLAALAHLSGYTIHPTLLLLLLITLPMLLMDIDPARYLALLSLFSFGPPLLYAIAQQHLAPRRWLRRFAWLPLLMLLGTGIALSNSHAVWQGLRQTGGSFLRTPKFRVVQDSPASPQTDPALQKPARWQLSAYRLPLSPIVWGEALLALYALLTAFVAYLTGQPGAMPFLLIYAAGFGLMVSVELAQALRAARLMRRRQRSRDRQLASLPAE